MTDYISRADAISIVHSAIEAEIPFAIVADLIKGLPSADAEKPCKTCGYYNLECPKDCEYSRPITSGYIADDKEVPPYTTTSAVSADRPSNVLQEKKLTPIEDYMTGKSRLADIPTEDYSDLPDIPRAYYEKIVGNMAHEINMLKQQLEDRPTHERDLISRHEALMELNGACEMWEDDAIVADIIHKLPSIEIVRCKDCIHSGWNKYSESLDCYYFADGDVDDNDFCSHGERREE